MSLTTDIIAYWDLRPSHYSAGVVTDLSGNGHNLTLTGSSITTNSSAYGPISTIVPYDSLTSFLGKNNISVYQGGTDLGARINISSGGSITIVDGGNRYQTGTATIGNNTRISITHNPNFFDCVALAANSYFTVNPSILPQLSGKSEFSMGGWTAVYTIGDAAARSNTIFGGGNSSIYGFSLSNIYGLITLDYVISGAATISDGSVARYPNSFGGTQRFNLPITNSLTGQNALWQHIFMTYKKGTNGRGTISIYLNGVPIGRNPAVLATGSNGGKVPTLTQPILINATRNTSGTVVPASTSAQQFLDLGIWGRQLSDDEVFNLYYRNNWNSYPFTKKTITPALTDNLEARWPLNQPDYEDANASEAYNVIHNSYTSTVNGHVLSGAHANYNSTGAVNIPGPLGGGISFVDELVNNSNVVGKLDCIMAGNFPTASFSINTWVRATSYTGNILKVMDPYIWNKNSISITKYGGNTYLVMKNYLDNGDVVSIFEGSLGGLELGGTWVNIAITFDGAFICYYQNGAFVSKTQVNLNTDSFGIIPATAASLAIPYKYSEIQIGNSAIKYSDLQIWSRPLSQQEVTSIYNKINSSVNLYVAPNGKTYNPATQQKPLSSAQRAWSIANSLLNWNTPPVIHVSGAITGANGDYLPNGPGISDGVTTTYKWYPNGDHTSQYVLSCTKLTNSPASYAWQIINNYDSSVVASTVPTVGSISSPDPWVRDWQNINVTYIKGNTGTSKNIHFAAGTYSGINTYGENWGSDISISGDGKTTTILGGISASRGNNYSVSVINGLSGGLIVRAQGSGGYIHIISDNTIDLSFVDSIGGIPVGNGGNISLIGCYVSYGVNTSAQPASLYVDGNGDPIVDPVAIKYNPADDDQNGNHNILDIIYPPTNPLSSAANIGQAGSIYLKNSTVNGNIYANSYGFNWKNVTGGSIEFVDSNRLNGEIENKGNNGGGRGSLKITTTNTGNNSNNSNGTLLSQILNLPFSL